MTKLLSKIIMIILCFCHSFSFSQDKIYCKTHKHYVNDAGHIANTIVEEALKAKENVKANLFELAKDFKVESNQYRNEMTGYCPIHREYIQEMGLERVYCYSDHTRPTEPFTLNPATVKLPRSLLNRKAIVLSYPIKIIKGKQEIATTLITKKINTTNKLRRKWFKKNPKK